MSLVSERRKMKFKIQDRKRVILTVGCVILALFMLLYISGLIAQIANNYAEWMSADGLTGNVTMKAPSWNPITCIGQAFTVRGVFSLLAIITISGVIFLIYKLYDRFDGKKKDPRGFTTSNSGVYGTATFMTDKEMQKMLELTTPEKAEGIILGEYEGKTVCMPKNTRLNRHIAICGASGTMKSRAVIRNAIFQHLKNDESVVIADAKSELYTDTAEMFRANGYEVKVFNLVSPANSDSWNCMSDLGGDTLLAQVLTNVIIGNTSSGKGDHFWDNGEGNLLKALVLYIDKDATRSSADKHLPAVYQLLTQNSENQLMTMFSRLPLDHPARAPFNLFAQSSDTVRSGIILGLGTRLQVMQNKAVQNITSRSDIDLTAPGRKKCAYYLILSDQDTTMAFLSSLFFSFLMIKLTRYADSCGGKCPVPVNLVLDEFNNIGKLGGAEDGSDFTRFLSVCRSRDIRVMLAVQSLGQLQNRYPNNLWAEIIGNMDIQLMLGCTDEVSAKYFSNRCGEMSIEVNTTMTMRRTITIAQIIPQYRHVEGMGRRKLLTPDEVLRIPNEQLLCVVRGCNVLLLDKLDYTRHPYSKMIRQVSVYDYHPDIPKDESPEVPIMPEEKPTKKKKSNLYGSASPPTDF